MSGRTSGATSVSSRQGRSRRSCACSGGEGRGQREAGRCGRGSGGCAAKTGGRARGRRCGLLTMTKLDIGSGTGDRAWATMRLPGAEGEDADLLEGSRAVGAPAPDQGGGGSGAAAEVGGGAAWQRSSGWARAVGGYPSGLAGFCENRFGPFEGGARRCGGGWRRAPRFLASEADAETPARITLRRAERRGRIFPRVRRGEIHSLPKARNGGKLIYIVSIEIL